MDGGFVTVLLHRASHVDLLMPEQREG